GLRPRRFGGEGRARTCHLLAGVRAAAALCLPSPMAQGRRRAVGQSLRSALRHPVRRNAIRPPDASHHPRRRNAADGVMGRAVRFRARCRGIMAGTRASEGVPPMLSWAALVLALSLSAATAFAAESKWPNHHEADFVVKDYAFKSGESLPEVKIHYHTLGTPK